MALPIDNIIRISVSRTPAAQARAGFGRTLLLTRDNSVLDPAGAQKVRVYNRLSEVVESFASDTEPYKAATRYFSFSPTPKGLLIGRFNNASQNAIVEGDILSAAPTTAVAVNTIQIAGSNVGAIAAGSSGSAYAGLIQTAFSAVVSSTLVTWDATTSRFVVTWPDTTQRAITGAGATTLGLGAADGARYRTGKAAETEDEALDEIAAQNLPFYFITLEEDLNGSDSVTNVSTWANANSKFFMAEDNNDEPLTANETNSRIATLSAIGPPRTALNYHDAGEEYMSLMTAAGVSAIDLDNGGRLQTAKFLVLPGVSEAPLSQAQANELIRKRCNFYTGYGHDTFYAEGVMADVGGWIDTRYWLDWFVQKMQRELLAHLRQRETSQTASGIASLKNVANSVCQDGVASRGIAGGTVSEATKANIQAITGNIAFDGVLGTGYLVYIPPLSAQSQADREARESPPVYVFLKGSSALHFIEQSIAFEA